MIQIKASRQTHFEAPDNQSSFPESESMRKYPDSLPEAFENQSESQP